MARRILDLSPEDAYAIVTAVRDHGRWIPATRVTAPDRPLEAGDVVVARSAKIFVDRMRVTRTDPPRRLELVKTGPLLLGEVAITVRPAGPGRAEVEWTEDVHLRGPLPRAVTAAVLHPGLEAMTTLALWRIDRALRRRRAGT